MELKKITEELAGLENWSLENKAISKVFDFADFKSALNFVNKIGEISEKLGHHPDIIINYNKVKLKIFTHSENDLTNKDFELAKEIDKID